MKTTTPTDTPLEPVEIHTDGSKWIKCSAAEPKGGKLWNGLRIYHPDAVNDRSSSDGADDHFKCPNCGDSWWVEYDG